MGNSHPNGFGAHTTAEQAARDVDLHGKNVIVTGANGGIGLETVRVLAKHGANVVIASRDATRAQQALQTIKTSNPEAQVEVMQLDLASLASVREFAEQYKRLNRPLHILINNAGIMACSYAKTVDGYESQFATNHLGHFLLTNLLIDELERGAPSRVVSVSSKAHQMSGMDFDNLLSEKSYGAWAAYSRSKSANILFAVELNKRFASRGIYANALHPGMIKTDLWKHTKFEVLAKVGTVIGTNKHVSQGAATSVYIATAPELEKVGGKYFDNCNEVTAKSYATDPENARRLWDASLVLVGGMLPQSQVLPSQVESLQNLAPNQAESPQNLVLNQVESPQNPAVEQVASPQNLATDQPEVHQNLETDPTN